jgi:hypothetical protein
VPVPWLNPILVTLPSSGELSLDFVVENVLPPAVTMFVQWVIVDGAAIAGYALSNAVVGVTP